MADDGWIYDCIYQFLKSPAWRCPLQDFIDTNCVVFDTSEENALAFTQIHQSLRELVDKLLGDQLSEFGITSEQFVAACESSQNKELHALVTEYILALDDFQTFKRMMEKRNVELELEAMRGIKWGDDGNPIEETATDEDIEAAIAASMQDADYVAKQLELEQAELAHALAISLALEEERVRRLAEETTEAPAPAPVPVQAPEIPIPTDRSSTDQKPTLGSVKLTRLSAAGFGAKPALPDIVRTEKPVAAPASAPAAAPQAAPSAEDLAKRQAYLKAQKEKLIQQQKVEREKELKDYVEKNTKAAETKPESEVDDAHRQMRLALVRRFKDDLIQETKQAALRSGQ